MVKSMTGYGRAEEKTAGGTLTVEVRSVNNRYLDCNVRIPRLYLFAEETLKSRVQDTISRGKVDVFVTLDSAGAEQVKVTVNQPAADAYYAALKGLAAAYGLEERDITVSLLSRFPRCWWPRRWRRTRRRRPGRSAPSWTGPWPTSTRCAPGRGSACGRTQRSTAAAIEDMVGQVEARSPQTVAEYRAKLEARMQEVLSNTQLDPARILTEAAIFCRQGGGGRGDGAPAQPHRAAAGAACPGAGPVGRKLDFLIQEFNREANTIGSKCSDLDIARQVVDIKAEIEKIREQVQNIE